MAHVDDLGNEILQQRWAKAKIGKGRRAPVGTVLEIKGGWLDACDCQCFDEYEADRSLEIHETDWTWALVRDRRRD